MRRTSILPLLLLALVLLPAAAVAGSSGVASNSKSFPDSTGEDPAAPDITSMRVANDDAGLVTFQIAIRNRPALAQDMLLLLFVDSLQGRGDPEAFGADYAIQLEPAGIALFKWDGSDYTFASSSVAFAWAASGPTIRISASDLGKPKTINFVTVALSGITIDANGNANFDSAHTDTAPDAGRGTYTYDVRTTFRLTAAGFSTGPKPVRAGKSFSAGLAARQNDTGGLVQQGKITCTARIANAPARLRTSRLRNGIGACVWTIPSDAKGKTIRGTVTIVVQGARLERNFSARIT